MGEIQFSNENIRMQQFFSEVAKELFKLWSRRLILGNSDARLTGYAVLSPQKLLAQKNMVGFSRDFRKNESIYEQAVNGHRDLAEKIDDLMYNIILGKNIKLPKRMIPLNTPDEFLIFLKFLMNL